MGKLKIPRSTQVPDEIFDEYMATLSGAEFKVLCYIARRTFGFRKEADTISISQICDGITRKDGRVLDRGTGLSRASAFSALKTLCTEDGPVIAEKRTVENSGEKDITSYRLNLDDSEVVQKLDHQVVQNLDQGWSKNQTTGVVQKLDLQHTVVLQDTVHNIPPSPFSQETQNLKPNTNSENQNPTHPPVPDAPPATDADEHLLDVVGTSKILASRLRQLRGGKPPTKDIRDLITQQVEKCGRSQSELLGAWEAFALETFWRDYDARHRVNSFFAGLDSPRTAPRRALARPGSIASVPEDTNQREAAAGPSLPPLVAKWNELLPASVHVNYWTRNSPAKELAEAEADPEFVAGFERICQTCRDLIENGNGKVTGVSFLWMVRRWKVDESANWYKILHGGYAYAIKPKPAPPAALVLPPVYTPPPETRIKCYHCTKLREPDDKHCPSCGYPAVPVPKGVPATNGTHRRKPAPSDPVDLATRLPGVSPEN